MQYSQKRSVAAGYGPIDAQELDNLSDDVNEQSIERTVIERQCSIDNETHTYHNYIRMNTMEADVFFKPQV